jgi:O-antigen/teichoic acid export membrane protein
MGTGFDSTVKVLYLLVVPACIFMPQVTSNSILLGIEKHRLLFYVLAAEAVSNVVISVVLVQAIGLYGVALGAAIPQLIIYTVVYPVVYHRVLQAKLRDFYVQSGKSIAASALVTVPTAFLMKSLLPAASWLSFFVDVGITGLAILAGFLFLIVEKGDRSRVLSLVRVRR